MVGIVNDQYEHGKVIFCDCLDKDNGMPSLDDDSFELGFTDAPWGDNIHKRVENKRLYHTSVLEVGDNKKYYKDKFDPKWNLVWFKELKRVSKYQILVISERHKYWWIRNTNPIGDITIQWINGYSSSKVAKWNRKSTYLVYAKKLENKLDYNLISIVIPNRLLRWGFLSDWKGKHPTPKGVEIPLILFKQLKPKSVIDPFIGSGSYPKACEMLNIKWFGYEINKEYRSDIKMRMEKREKTKGDVSFWLK